MRAYDLVSCVIGGEIWLHDLGSISVCYLSDTLFEGLDDGYTTNCRPGMRFVTWCIVKLYCYITLCRAFHILIVANDISHMGIKTISCIWVVGDLTNMSYLSDHI